MIDYVQLLDGLFLAPLIVSMTASIEETSEKIVLFFHLFLQRTVSPHKTVAMRVQIDSG